MAKDDKFEVGATSEPQEKTAAETAEALVEQLVAAIRKLGVIPSGAAEARGLAEAAFARKDWAEVAMWAQLGLAELGIGADEVEDPEPEAVKAGNDPEQIDRICLRCGAIGPEGVKVCDACGADPNTMPEPPAAAEAPAEDLEAKAQAAAEMSTEASNPGDNAGETCGRCGKTFKGRLFFTATGPEGKVVGCCKKCAQAYRVLGWKVIPEVAPALCKCGNELDATCLGADGVHLVRPCRKCRDKQHAANTDKAAEKSPDGTQRERGTVKWFSDRKGYGFISRRSKDDMFVHYSEVQGEGFRNLTEGQRVEFAVKQGPKGLQATKVVVLKKGDNPGKTDPTSLKASRGKAPKPRQGKRTGGGAPWTEADEKEAVGRAATEAANLLKSAARLGAHVRDARVDELVAKAKAALASGNGRQAKGLALQALAKAVELDRPRKEAERARAEAELAAKRERRKGERAARGAKRKAAESAQAKAAALLEELQTRVCYLDKELDVQVGRIAGLLEADQRKFAPGVPSLRDWAERLFGEQAGWTTWEPDGSVSAADVKGFVVALNRLDADLRRAEKAVKEAKKAKGKKTSPHSDGDGPPRKRTPYIRSQRGGRRTGWADWLVEENLSPADLGDADAWA